MSTTTDSPIPGPTQRRAKPRLPWKRGPAAGRVVAQVGEVRARLAATRRNFFSLRRAATLLGLSLQPVRDWVRQGYLKRAGPRGQVPKSELRRFVDWLADRAEPFSYAGHTARLTRGLDRPKYSFQKVKEARLSWPRGRETLTPLELADLIGCHPSFIRRALRDHWQRWIRRGQPPDRWRITRRKWQNTFPCSVINPR